MTSFDAVVTVRRARYVNESSGWAVLDAAAEDGAAVVLVGPLVHLEDRERARVIGTWVDDSRFGRQVKVTEAHPLPPSDAEALIAYLRRVRHVGARRAAALVDRFGADALLDAIDRDPTAAFAGVGLGPARAEEATRSWDGLRAMRRLHLMLAPHGLAYLVGRVQEHFGEGAARIVTARPYELTSVFGVGFQIADRIAAGAGTAPDARERARAGVLHLLGEAERSGSTCMAFGTLRRELGELLAVSDPPGESFIDELVAAGDLARAGEWIYRRTTAELEAELAERVRELIAGTPGGRLADPGLGAAEGEPDDAAAAPVLTPEQLAAVRAAFVHRLSLITGGPGTGKTATIRTIGAVGVAQGARVMLVAPTGRAAIRMTEATGITARTVHSALGWIPGEGPTHDEEDPLACDLLIVDESSMANLELMVMLLRAVGPKTSVVLVGDADQLAPVGAGKPFAELIGTELIPTARLTHIFRQAAGSMIVQGAHAVRRGEAPDFSAGGADMRRDLFLIERSDPIAAREEIVSLVASRLPAHYGIDPIADIQVFAPVYRGELGIDRLNEALRAALNPDGAAVRGGRFRIGDKLMLTGRNLHDLGLMNGMLLRLLDEIGSDGDDDPALLLSAEEAIFRLPADDAERLKLAYACSVHRGQGIELPVAIIVAHPAAGAFFLRREMLYTAITRAKLATVIVGTREVIQRAARTPDTGRRHSRVAARLRDELADE